VISGMAALLSRGDWRLDPSPSISSSPIVSQRGAVSCGDSPHDRGRKLGASPPRTRERQRSPGATDYVSLPIACWHRSEEHDAVISGGDDGGPTRGAQQHRPEIV